MDAFEQWVRGGLELAGRELADGDVDLLRVVHGLYAPILDSFDALDVRGLPLEPGLHPGRAPETG